MRGIFKKKILLVLLNSPKGNLTKYRIAKTAGCTPSWAIMFLKELEKAKLIKGTKVTNYKGLLEYYRKIYKSPKFKQYSVSHIDKFFNNLKKSKLDYRLTTYYAENMVQSYLFPSKIDIYVKKDEFEKWHEFMKEFGLVGGGNVRLFLSDESVFYREIKVKGIKIASFPQLVVDLLNEGGAAVEAGEMLLKKVSEFVS